MKFFINNIHSMIDVITNSSTELFVCVNEKNILLIKSVLELEWKNYIKENPILYDFEDKVVYNEKSVWEVLQVRTGLRESEEENLEEGYDWGYEDLVHEDTIIIEGLEDNSIPFEFIEIIEDIFNVRRFHLG